MHPKIREARWQNALHWANAVNAALASGAVLWWKNDERGGRICRPLEITATKIVERYDKKSTALIFENDPDWDHGLYDTPAKFRRDHAVLCCRDPIEL
jgi:hypothetical protein